MGTYRDANLRDVLITHIEAIADNLCGEEATPNYGGDRLRHALGRIADYFDGASVPAVTTTDNGKILKVSGGKWTAAAETKELPAVTADDNGKVLLVSNGAWGAGAQAVELPAVTADDNGKVLKVVDGAWAVAAEG